MDPEQWGTSEFSWRDYAPKPIVGHPFSATLYKAYGVYEQLDKTEGRGGERLLGLFHSEADAIVAARGRGVMGLPGDIRQVSVLSKDGGITGFIFNPNDNVIEIQPPDLDMIKKNALSKLTAQEKRVLGLQ